MRTLIFIVSYNADQHIEKVLRDIPDRFKNTPDAEILMVDDASRDRTVETARAYVDKNNIGNVTILKNPINQGYGGNQKIGYRYAIERKFDVVAMLHGDWQYTPLALPELIAPFEKDPDLACVLAVRFGNKYSPLKGGMPLYKFVGNQILTKVQNRLAGANFHEWHTGYRVYATKALSQIAFELNTNDFHFDTEILLQLLERKLKFAEINIPTRYGSEICHVDGMRYGKDVLKACFKFRLQKYHLLYDIRYHPAAALNRDAKANGGSEWAGIDPHVFDELVPSGSKVLMIGTSSVKVSDWASRRSLKITESDPQNNPDQAVALLESGDFDVVMMVGGLNRLAQPEFALLDLYRARFKKTPVFIFTSANVAFLVVRFMLLMGFFNYGQRGILSLDVKRLLSLRTFRNLIEQSGFIVRSVRYLPFPFESLPFRSATLSLLGRLNRLFLNMAPSLFAFHVVIEARPLAKPAALLSEMIHKDLSS